MADVAVQNDLQAVADKVQLLTEMSGSMDPTDEGEPDDILSWNAAGHPESCAWFSVLIALLDVIGFLEACAPRLIDLIEAASNGVLSEVTLMQCLDVNDKLLAVLSSSSDGSNGTPAAAASSSSTPSASALGVSDQPAPHDLLLSPSSAAAPAASQGLDLAAAAAAADPFAGADLLVPTTGGFVGGKSTGDDTDFDALMGAGGGKGAPPLRAVSGQMGAAPLTRGVSGGPALDLMSADPFASLPPPVPQGVQQTKSDDLFNDFVGARKG